MPRSATGLRTGGSEIELRRPRTGRSSAHLHVFHDHNRGDDDDGDDDDDDDGNKRRELTTFVPMFPMMTGEQTRGTHDICSHDSHDDYDDDDDDDDDDEDDDDVDDDDAEDDDDDDDDDDDPTVWGTTAWNSRHVFPCFP